jgi:hypothetical protein
MKRRNILQAALALVTPALLPRLAHATTRGSCCEIAVYFRGTGEKCPPLVEEPIDPPRVWIDEEGKRQECRMSVTTDSPIDKRLMRLLKDRTFWGEYVPDLSHEIEFEYFDHEGRHWAIDPQSSWSRGNGIMACPAGRLFDEAGPRDLKWPGAVYMNSWIRFTAADQQYRKATGYKWPDPELDEFEARLQDSLSHVIVRFWLKRKGTL